MAVITFFSNFRSAFSATGTPDLSGYPEWPAANVRAGGFTSVTMPRPITTFPFQISVNNGAVDSPLFVDQYDWYVAQGTDDSTRQRLIVTQFLPAKSGTINIDAQSSVYFQIFPKPDVLIPAGDPAMGFQATAQLLFKNVWVYALRKGDGAIQAINILKESFSTSGP